MACRPNKKRRCRAEPAAPLSRMSNKINWSVDLVAVSLPRESINRSQKIAAVENCAAPRLDAIREQPMTDAQHAEIQQ
jgi:hypothetical protein